MKYIFVIENTNNGDQYEIPYRELRVYEELNWGMNGTAKFDYLTVKNILSDYGVDPIFVFSGGFREVTIYRNDSKIFIGAVSDFGLEVDEDGEITIDIRFIDYLGLLSKRRTAVVQSYDTQDISDVIWDMVNTTQNSDTYGDLGITRGANPITRDVSETFRFEKVRDAIISMTNENRDDAVDVDIDITKKINVYYPTKGEDRPNSIFDITNMLPWRYSKPLLLKMTNKVHVMGQGYNDDVIYRTRTAPDSYRSVYGLLEDVLSMRNEASSNVLDEVGDRFLKDNQSPIAKFSNLKHADGNPNITEYNVGDTIRLSVPQIQHNFLKPRVLAREITINETNPDGYVVLGIQ